MKPRFEIGDRVRVRADTPKGHFRTPGYIQGRIGHVEAIHGAFPNPESRAHGGDGLPPVVLYLVGFSQRMVWKDYGGAREDDLLVDVYEHWLEVVE